MWGHGTRLRASLGTEMGPWEAFGHFLCHSGGKTCPVLASLPLGLLKRLK